jgi:putative transcriptional regulator
MRIDRIKLVTEMARSEIKLYELAEKSGLTRATITAIKGGKSCKEETAVKLAAGLGVPLADLLQECGVS